MAPLKTVNKLPPTGFSMKEGIKTRSQGVPMKKEIFPKRKAEESPLKRLTVKRSALTELTNVNVDMKVSKDVAKENVIHAVKAKLTTTATLKKTVTVNVPCLAQTGLNRKPKVVPRKPLADQKNHANINIPRPAELKEKPPVPAKPPKKEPSSGIAPSTGTLKQPNNVPVAIKAIRKQQLHENQVQSVGVMTRRSLARKSLELEKSSDNSLLEESSKTAKSTKKVWKTVVKVERKPPPGIDDYDQEQLKDLFSASIYAMDIFDYLKRREKDFKVDDYINRQSDLNTTMRALLVDWMVEVQENFEVNHESLYLGVKLVDLYLSKNVIKKENLQLIGATGLFIACKYDERIPPALDDFVYVCDGLYHGDDLLIMERAMLRCVDYELGIPLSYRFLRRYARCGKYDMPLLTLARFILETSLMDYATIQCSDSKMAAAALYLALKMKGLDWTKTLEYYSGYRIDDVKDVVLKLNAFLHKPKNNLKTMKTKYSHPLFHEVSKIPLIPSESLDFKTATVS
uniref:G2/mitotic-specific cyclin-B3 n=1 Tax=Lygus hesperus TaxID=30085 RepID=A0A0A9XLG3_LYGHE